MLSYHRALFEVLSFALLDYGLQKVLSSLWLRFWTLHFELFGSSFGAPSADTKVIRFLAGIVGTPMA